MCGIAGLFSPRSNPGAEALAQIGTKMNAALRHRGPDAEGAWVDADVGLVLAHRRLSIIDLSPNGAQPMVSSCGRYVLTFNGEIYNFADLQAELAAADSPPSFRGHSDTEVLLNALIRWGIRATLARCNGMFAFALWDRTLRRLTVARDRLGEKPLYYALNPIRFGFGSELKALRAAGLLSGEINSTALGDFLRFGYIPAPLSIWQGVAKLPPGCFLEVSTTADGTLTAGAPTAYWSLADVARAGQAARSPRPTEEIDAEFDRLLTDSVRLRNFADVPIGAFLSGGLDSTAVVTALQSVSAQPVRTFTVGFEAGLFDERAEARAVANQLGCEHRDFIVHTREFFDLVQRLPEIYDEPFGDASQIPSCLVCSLARQHVTVCFSGDGGDELFGGYLRYQTHARLWRINRLMRTFFGRNAANGLNALGRHLPGAFDGLARPALRRLAPGFDSLPAALSRVAKLSYAENPGQLYRHMMSAWIFPEEALAAAPAEAADEFFADREQLGGLDALFLADQRLYLPENNLTKMDRASMQCALEVRIPLLDHRLVEFSWRLSPADKIAHGQGKLPLRRYLARRLPAEVLARPKRGFGVPVASWLRGELKPWAAELLLNRNTRGLELFDGPCLEDLWNRHQTGKFDFSNELWTVLAFLNWFSCQSAQ